MCCTSLRYISISVGARRNGRLFFGRYKEDHDQWILPTQADMASSTTVSQILQYPLVGHHHRVTDIPAHKVKDCKDLVVGVRRLQAYYFAVGELSDVYKCELHRSHEIVKNCLSTAIFSRSPVTQVAVKVLRGIPSDGDDKRIFDIVGIRGHSRCAED